MTRKSGAGDHRRWLPIVCDEGGLPTTPERTTAFDCHLARARLDGIRRRTGDNLMTFQSA